jgi:hypothetical protein
VLIINKIPFNLIIVFLRLEFAKRSICIIIALYRSKARFIKYFVTFYIILNYKLVRLVLLVLR